MTREKAYVVRYMGVTSSHRVVRVFDRMDVEDPVGATAVWSARYRFDLRYIAFLHG
ncbi:hypothetical protein [Paenibacillus sp. SI8]|uniref:hypothetical protein n=1 Tax=unclassified Paenibacillus TaxID=185978 RepID=UPI0034662D3E